MSHMYGHTRALVEGGILSGMAVILTLLGVYIPVLQTVIVLINALPIIIYVALHGVKKGIMASFVAGVLIAIFANPLNGLLFLIGLAPVALVLGWSFREQKPILGITLGAVASFIAYLAIIGMAVRFLNIDTLQHLKIVINESGTLLISVYKQIGVDEATLGIIVQMLNEMETYLMVVLPIMLLMVAFTISYANFWVAQATLRKLGRPVADFPPFKYWDFPRTFLYGWGISFASWQAGAYFFGTQALTYKFGQNCFLFFSAALFLQGYAVLAFFLAKHNVPKVIRILIAIVALGTSLINFMVIYAGVVDMFANFRRLARGEDK